MVYHWRGIALAQKKMLAVTIDCVAAGSKLFSYGYDHLFTRAADDSWNRPDNRTGTIREELDSRAVVSLSALKQF